MNRSSQGPRTKQQLSAAFTANINAYALAAGAAGVSLLAMIQPAEAEIVFTPTDKVIRINYYSVLDLNHDGKPDFKFNQYSVNYRYWWESLRMWPNGKNAVIESANGYAAVLSKGAPIGPEQIFVNGSFFKFARSSGFQGSTSTSRRTRVPNSQHKGPWWNVQDGYVGVAFTIGHAIHYGWIRLSLTGSYHSFQTTMTGFAYETVANQTIYAGQLSDEEASATGDSVPQAQPALGMLALGSRGLELWRRDEPSLPMP
jgi:hypothetical protein